MNEPHQRFQDWLTAGAEGDPPRDAAVHASVCTSCRQSIAALDRLAAVDPGRAPMPEAAVVGPREELARAARLGGIAAAVLVGAVLLGIGASRLIGLTRGDAPIAEASQTPAQGVLGGTATPQPSGDGFLESPGESAGGVATAVATPRPGGGPTPKPGSSARPTATPGASSTTGPTPTPSGVPTGNPTPTLAPTPTPTIAPEPTPTPTPTPTPIPTPAPSVPDAPAGLTASTTIVGRIDLQWTEPASNGSPITGYDIYRDNSFLVTTTSTSYQDFEVSPQSYDYFVIAHNAIGDGPPSATVMGTAL